MRTRTLAALACFAVVCTPAQMLAQTPDAVTPSIAAAHAHLRLDEPAEARRWLDAVPESGRAWEWNYLNALADMSERSARAHDGGALALAISPDGPIIATAGADNAIRLWRAPNLTPLGALHGHEAHIRALAFSPDGATLASASADSTVQLWDIHAKQHIATLDDHTEPVSFVSFSPDGSRLVSTGYFRDPAVGVDGVVMLWSVADAALSKEWRVGVKPVRVVAWAPDGKTFFTGDWDGDIHRIDPDTQEVTKVAALMTDDVYRAIDAIDVSADGATIFVGVKDNHVHRIDVASGEHAPLPDPHADNVLALDLSPDNRWLATGSVDLSIALRSADTGETFLTLRGHTGAVQRVVFSPGGDRLYSVAADGDLRSWLVAGADQCADELTPGAESHYTIRFSADEETIYTGGWCGLVHVIDAPTGVERLRFTAHDSSVNALDVTADGARIVTCSNDGTVRLHSAAGELLATGEGHANQLVDVAFSPDARTVVSVSSDAVIFRDAATLEPSARLESARAGRVAFSPDGARLALACADNSIRLIDAHTLEELAVLEGHTAVVRDVCFSADGARLASAGDDNTVRLWSVDSEQLLHTMTGHVLTVMAVAFSPTGDRLASAAYDQTVRIWDVETGAQRLALRPSVNNGLYDVAWSPDGAHVAAAVLGAPSMRWTTMPLPDRLHAQASHGR